MCTPEYLFGICHVACVCQPASSAAASMNLKDSVYFWCVLYMMAAAGGRCSWGENEHQHGKRPDACVCWPAHEVSTVYVAVWQGCAKSSCLSLLSTSWRHEGRRCECVCENIYITCECNACVCLCLQVCRYKCVLGCVLSAFENVCECVFVYVFIHIWCIDFHMCKCL